MSTHRHHIHIICDKTDASLHDTLDNLAIFFTKQAYLTYDLFGTDEKVASYSWQCINSCDFVILLIGKSYGPLKASGVSQLHVSYLNAKTRQKKISVIVNPNTKDRKLGDLLSLIEKQNFDIYHTQDTADDMVLFETIYRHFAHLAPSPNKINRPNNNLAYISQAPSDRPRRTPPKTSPKQQYTPIKEYLNIKDVIYLNCSAHAFRGGTLIEVSFITNQSWRTILLALLNVGLTFSVQGLWRTLNKIIEPYAMPAVIQTHPDVHAISRCQVVKSDVYWVLDELTHTGMIEKIEPINNTNTQKEAWRLSAFTKHELQK